MYLKNIQTEISVDKEHVTTKTTSLNFIHHIQPLIEDIGKYYDKISIVKAMNRLLLS